MTTPIDNGTLGTKLLSVLMQYIRHEEKPWGQLTSQEQQELLESLQEQIDDTLRAAVVSILAGGLPKIAGTLKSVVAANGVRATIDIAGGISDMSTEALHDLVDRCGSSVVIVLVGPEEHQVEIDKFSDAVQPDQPQLPGFYEPCDHKHASPVCADPNCWQRPDTTVGADEEEEDDDD